MDSPLPPRSTLDGFAYGEDLEGLPPRSLGYRLLAPPEPEPWRAEVEALARRLQGAPYPDHWPPTDLFCSVLIADGRRLIAVARYGLADHTPSRRRGGLELVGVLAPADLDILTALAVYRWLRTRRSQSDDLHTLGGHVALADVLAAVAPAEAPADPVPVLPIRLWQEGALLFAATAPSDSDHRLGLLEQGAGRAWQWLPLVGPDFPLATYAQRGPLVAWTPHLAGVAVKVERKQADGQAAPAPWQRRALAAVLALVILLGLLGGANLWATFALGKRVASLPQPQPGAPPEPTVAQPTPATNLAPPADESRERFAEALHDLLQERLGPREWDQGRPHFLAAYEQVAQKRPDLRLKESNAKGRAALGAVLVLSGRGADRLEEVIKTALANKGYDAGLVKSAAERVRQQLIDDLKEGR
jgi:hypothetical protein